MLFKFKFDAYSFSTTTTSIYDLLVKLNNCAKYQVTIITIAFTINKILQISDQLINCDKF